MERGLGELCSCRGCGAPTMIQEIGFALDSPLEEAGFEPSVPGNRDTLFDPPSRASASPKVVAFGIASGEGPPRAPITVPGRAQRRLPVEAKWKCYSDRTNEVRPGSGLRACRIAKGARL